MNTSADTTTFVREVTKYLGEERVSRPLTQKVTRLFQKMSQAASGRQTAIVESVVPLSSGEKRTIEAVLRQKIGKRPNPSYRMNPDLLLGLRIQVGDLLVDTSGRTYLTQLLASLSAG